MCPAQTPIATPVEVSCSFNPGSVTSVEIVIPTGHKGTTGLQLALAHQQVVPFTAGAWLIDDGARPVYELDEHPDSGAWSVFLYNLDNRSHQWQIRFKITEIRRNAFRPAPAPLAVDDIYSVARGFR